MKQFISKYKFIILFFVFIALSHLIQKVNFKYIEKSTNIEYINTKLSDKEKITEQWIDSLLQNIQNADFTNWLNSKNSHLNWLYKDEGISFYMYDNNKLSYWTNNAITIPNDTNWLADRFNILPNAYVVNLSKTIDSITIVGTITIKSNYPYENKFLSNVYHPSFKIEEPLTLYINSKNSDGSIHSKTGEYLFSLKNPPNQNQTISRNIAYILLLLSVIFLILAGRSFFEKKQLSKIQFIIFSAIVLIVRFGFQYFGWPDLLYSLEIFHPKYLAFSQIFTSIGELLITSIVFCYLTFVFYLKVPVSPFPEKLNKSSILKIVFWFTIITTYGFISYYIFEHLIIDSNFQYEAYDVLNLSVFSFLGYFIIAIIFISLLLLFDKACNQIKTSLSLNKFIAIIFVYLVALGLIILLISNKLPYISLLFFGSVLTYWSYIRFTKPPHFGSFVIVIAIFSVFATYFIRTKNFNKRIEESKVLAVNLAREQDPVAEIILSDIVKTLPTDTTIANQLMQENFNFDQFVNYINQNYFTGYLGRYVFQLTICNKFDSLRIDDQENMEYCFSFFDSLLENNGIELGIPGLYQLKNEIGGVNYFLKAEIPLSNDWENVNLYIELISKPNFSVLGYPELLLEKPIKIYESVKKVNYAKYINNQLVHRAGDFPYSLDRLSYGYLNDEFAFFQSEDYDHIIFNADKDNTLIISYPTVHFYNIVISFTYIFLFLLVQVTILLVLVNRLTNLIDINFSIKNKIIYSMIIILFTSLVFVGGGTIFYTYQQFENNQYNLLSEKIQSVLVELEHKLSHANEIHEIDPEYINSLLVKFSNVFYSDINLYDLEGKLVATSRGEIFDRNLTSSKINANAYRELVLNKKARIVQKEHIGDLDYYSAYIPFTSADNRILAYLNLPYFSKEDLLRQELMRVVVAIINIYAFLIIISIAVAVYISNKLTQPLRLVQQRIKNINLSKENEHIQYNGDDEIAELVVEYNRMLDQIDTSAKLLAKSERESAWREMARQIAHEIKNPLTPMKLSVQLLQRSWSNNDTDFEDRFNRFSKTLIQQIDSLSSIATAFSQFARMPISQTAKVDIIERVQHSVELYKEHSDCILELTKPENTQLYVRADKERLLQVFNNLIKNAIHAIPKNKQGKVQIQFKKTEQSVVVEINDNGIGIPDFMTDKLFEPNFTTKSSGTGLGLAIVKNIVEEIGGAIWFESSKEAGTTFFVSMPLFIDD